MLIGISGKSGVGKSEFAKRFFPNAKIIHIDEIGHEVMAEPDIVKLIQEKYGVHPVDDRKKLGEILFTNRHEMQFVSDLSYVKMKEKIDKIIKETKDTDVVLDWILLPHTDYFKMCDLTILIKADNDKRINHVLSRDNITKEYLDNRDKNSIEYNEDEFSYVVYNNYK